MNKKYIYVLDYCTDRLVEIITNRNIDPLVAISDLGFNEDECNYMVSDNYLDVEQFNYPEDV